MPSKLLRNALILGLLTAVGPFAIDMYLPALPSIARSLGAGAGAVQMTLMAFLVTMGLGQLVNGPLADVLGRKPPLYFGLALFVVASVGCMLAPDIRTLVAFRLLQGLGASAAMVVPIAVVRDLHTGAEAARLMSLLMLVFSVSPILSPVVGTFVVEVWGWRAIFAVVTCAAVLGLVLLATLLPETRPAAIRQESAGLRGVLAGYRTLLADRNFIGLALIVAFGIASFFAFLANSSFLLIEHFGLTPRQYSLAFSLNAASFIGASQLTGWLGRRVGLQRVVRIGVSGFAVTMTILFAVTLTGVDRLGALLPPLLVGYGFLGLVIPTTTVLALDDHGAIAGTASAFIATLESLVGVTVVAIVGLFLDGTARPMMGGIAGCAVVTFALAQRALGGSSVAEEPAV
jgi:DHA1 family bicyclomycin/chloramphenicol resistance-like MFS transporter